MRQGATLVQLVDLVASPMICGMWYNEVLNLKWRDGMATGTKFTKTKIAVLPRSFDPIEYLSKVDRGEVDARFFGKTLGKKGGLVYVETDEGVYEFKHNHIKSIRPIHKELDMLTISREATFVMRGTMARAIRLSASEGYQRVSDEAIEEMVQSKAPLREIVDTLGGLGTREWRG